MIKDTARIGSGISPKGRRIPQRKKRTAKSFEPMVNRILQEGFAYSKLLRENDLSDMLPEDIRRLKQAIGHAQKVHKYFQKIDKRANEILQLALKEHNINEAWTLQVDTRLSILQATTNSISPFINFFFHIPSKSKWKRNFRRSPTYRIMPLEIPVRWLDMSTQQLESEFQLRLKRPFYL